MSNESSFNGSKRHILEWISHENFVDSFNSLMADSKVILSTKEHLKPKSLKHPSEYSIATYCKEMSSKFGFLKNGIDLDKWWAPKGGKLPTWDLISVCDINGKTELLLVEAKAHKSEFSKDGKKSNALEGSNSNINHKNIGVCIEKANSLLPEFEINLNRHYQLANRITSAWKLSSLGIPVILLYLGFTGDDYFTKDCFIDDTHWKKEFQKYINGIVPASFINNLESEPFLFFEKSKNISQP